jgi:hypothetical protein
MKLFFPGTRGDIDARTRMHSCLLVEGQVLIDCGADWLDKLEQLRPTVIVLTHASVWKRPFPDSGFLHLSCGTSGDPTMDAQIRITIDDLKRRMESGEDFTIIDVRNPQAWAESDTMIPESIRMPLDDV